MEVFMKYERRWFLVLALLAFTGLFFTACPTDEEESPPEVITYTVTFDLDYSGGVAPAPAVVENGQPALRLFPTDPLRADHVFSGWYDGETRYTQYTAITKNVTLKARWEALYTLTFEMGYPDAPTPAPIVLKSGQSGGILFPPDPEREDYIFRGWYSESVKYDATTVITASATLTADWFQGYLVTFEVVGGMAAVGEPVLVERGQSLGDQFPADLQLPAKFTFDGWYDGETKYEATTAITGDVTLTGKWTKAADVERITARNAGNPVFKFTVPAGGTFGDYTKLTVKFLLNEENKSTAAPVIRLYGSYAASDFSDTGTRYWHGPPGNYLMFNNNMTKPDPLPQKEWFTIEIPFDLPKFNADHFEAVFPKSDATGDFYFALGLSLGGGSGSAVPVTSYMTEVTLSDAAGDKTIVSTGGGFDKPAMIGNVNGDVDDDGSNTGDITRK
jgi:uncharacterized repeat protein (TIGR02543 family)